MDEVELTMVGIVCFTIIAIIAIVGVADYFDDKIVAQTFQVCIQETKNVLECKLAIHLK